MKLTAAIAMALCAAATLGAAGDDVPLPDPCALVGRADVEPIIGALKAAPRSSRNDPSRVCQYESVKGTFLSIFVSPARKFDSARREMKDVPLIAGIGDGAFLYRNDRLETVQLVAKKKALAVLVMLSDSAGADEKVKSVARKALERL